MATTNSYQATRLNQLDTQAIFNQIIYKPKLFALGSGQGNWKPVPYANARKDILKISLDEMQKQPNTIADNVFRRIGITSISEKISIQPLVLEMVESGFEERNIQDVIPLVLTELNMIFDNVTGKTLAKVAKTGTAITWKCAPSFVNDMISKLSVLPPEMPKVIIIPTKVNIALRSISNYAEIQNWRVELSTRTRDLNAEIVISDYIGDTVYIIQKPLLAEYQGLFPQVQRDGFDERSNEYWLHFLMSSSDFKTRTPDAITSYAVSSLDLTKISDVFKKSLENLGNIDSKAGKAMMYANQGMQLLEQIKGPLGKTNSIVGSLIGKSDSISDLASMGNVSSGQVMSLFAGFSESSSQEDTMSMLQQFMQKSIAENREVAGTRTDGTKYNAIDSFYGVISKLNDIKKELANENTSAASRKQLLDSKVESFPLFKITTSHSFASHNEKTSSDLNLNNLSL